MIQSRQESAYSVRFHPDGPLYVGDQVSMEVLAPGNANLNKVKAYVTLAGPEKKSLGQAEFGGYSGGFRAIFQWVWDTHGLAPGQYRLLFSIPDRRLAWQEVVKLGQAPADIAQAHWESRETECCVVHYITGTDVEKDLDQLLPMVDAQARDITEKMGLQLEKKLDIDLIPRVLGQGGFASDEAYISYRRDNYANQNAAMLIHHELVHRFDSQVRSDLRPTFLMEGLAVYLSGGHYQPEPVMLRAASLLDMGQYIPLPYLIDNFYPSQHETGYIEAGALIEYMVQTWGWDRYNAFYRDIHAQPGGSQAKAIDVALQTHYGVTLKQLESQFTRYLESLPEVPDIRLDVQETIRLFDTIRQYQKQLDPSAYFEQVWLPDARQMREKGIVGDYLRGPNQPENQKIEGMLFDAGSKLNHGQFQGASLLIDEVQDLLQKARQRSPQLITAQ